MAHARTLKNQKYHVVAVIGDGALTGGMAYEALSSARHLSGAAARGAQRQQYVDRQECRRTQPPFVAPARQSAVSACENPHQGAAQPYSGRRNDHARGFALQGKDQAAVLPTSLFEQMGFTYLGPVDGHDLKSVCEFLALAKKMKKPVLLHVMTQKGRGYAPSEQYPEKYHGVSKFDRVTGAPLAAKKEDFSAFFGKELCALAEKDNRICAITAAMPSRHGPDPLCREIPGTLFRCRHRRGATPSVWRPVWRHRDWCR